MPRDIEPNVPVKDLGKGEGSPKADKPPSPSTAEDTLEVVKPPSLRSIEDTPEMPKSPSSKGTKGTSKMTKPPSPTANEETPGTNWGDNSKEDSLSPSFQTEGLGATANAPSRDGLTQPWVKEMPWSPQQVSDSLAQDPDFIKVGCHIGKYIMDVVNTEAVQAYIQVHWSNLDSASLRINVSSLFHLVLLLVS
jgi:hypothetical protein